MALSRRGLLGGMLAALAAPAIIRTPGLLMPVRPLVRGHWSGEFLTSDSAWFLVTDADLRLPMVAKPEIIARNVLLYPTEVNIAMVRRAIANWTRSYPDAA